MKRVFIFYLIILFFAILVGFGLFLFTTSKSSILKKHKIEEFIIQQFDNDADHENIQVLLLFHAADYFVYKGVPIGFQYEMLKELEKGLDKNINIKIENNPDKILQEVNRGNYDIISTDFIPSGFLLPFIEQSFPHSYSYPVIVSEKGSNTSNSNIIFVSSDFSANFFFNNDSPFHNYCIQKCKEYSTEELFEKVDNGELKYLICDYNQAITLIPFYSNVQIVDKAGPLFERRWFLNKKNVQLNENINHWLLEFKQTATYRWLLKKYFASESALINASFSKKQKANISKYDAIIKKYSKQYGFDWRFIASIIYQESKFISGLTGKGGSHGLMQLMPVTMDYYGISEEDGDEENIRVGIQHLDFIRKSFDDIEDDEEKLYFIAAAYNAGRGHIFDAQRLCTKYKNDYREWKNVSKYLILKSQHEFANDSLVKSGYFPGIYAVKYAQQVMERYSGYKAAYP